MHVHTHSDVVAAALFFAFFYGLLLAAAYLPSLTARVFRRGRRGLAARSRRASGFGNHTTGLTLMPMGTSTVSKQATLVPVTTERVRTRGRETFRGSSKIGSLTDSGSDTGTALGPDTTGAQDE